MGFGRAGRAGWVGRLGVLGALGADLAFCVWSTLYMSSSCLHAGYLIYFIYLHCLGSMLVSL